jgi:hypothetical protein
MTVSSDVREALEISVCAAALAGRRSQALESFPVFKAWDLLAPRDALGAIGMALALHQQGEEDQAFALLDSVDDNQIRGGIAAELKQDFFPDKMGRDTGLLAGPASLRGG